jgi:hypothetical protein
VLWGLGLAVASLLLGGLGACFLIGGIGALSQDRSAFPMAVIMLLLAAAAFAGVVKVLKKEG